MARISKGTGKAPIDRVTARKRLEEGRSLALVNKVEEAIEANDDVISSFKNQNENDPVLVEALVNKAVLLCRTNRSVEARATLDQVVLRYGGRREAEFKDLVNKALYAKSKDHTMAGKPDAALECLKQMIERSKDPSQVRWLYEAMRETGATLSRMGRASEATGARAEAKKIAPDAATLPQVVPLSNHRALVDRIDMLLGKCVPEKCEVFRKEMAKRKGNAVDFMSAKSHFSPDFSVLLVLREWNSYTPVIPSDQETDRGGGYFLYHRGKGIVIDPGYDFIENFYRAGGRIHDINAVVITHAHDDHTADFEALMTLIHQYNAARRGGEPLKVSLYLSLGAERKLSGFYRLREDSRIARLMVMNRCEGTQIQRFDLFDGVALTVLPAYHDDQMTADSSVGLCFDLDCGNQVKRRVVFTGDTGLYPKQLDISGNPKMSVPDCSDKEWPLLDTEDERLALHERYRALLGRIDGNSALGIDLLVPHLGSIQDYELNPPSPDPEEILLYANHLGLRGTAILVSQLRPREVILSEFGAELREVKSELCRLLQGAITPNLCEQAEHLIVPGDVTIVYDMSPPA